MIGFKTTVAALGMMVAAATAQAQTVYKVGSTPTGTPFTFLDAKTNTIQGMMPIRPSSPAASSSASRSRERSA